MVFEVMVKQLGHRPVEATQLISAALGRRPGRRLARGAVRRDLPRRQAMNDEAQVMSRTALPEETQLERQLRPQRLDEYVGQRDAVESLRVSVEAARQRQARRSTTCCSRAARARQDDAGHHHGQRDGRVHRHDRRPVARARRRPDGHRHQLERARRPVHRRDPPPSARGGGASLPGDGGLHRQFRHGQGAQRADHADSAPTLHAGGGDDAPGDAELAAARALRHLPPPRLLLRARTSPRSSGARPPSWRWPSIRRGPPPSPAARAGRRASRTGCCAACATTARCAGTGGSPRPPPPTRSTAREWTPSGSIGSTAASSWRSSSSTTAAPSGLEAIAATINDEAETLAEVVEPFLLKIGYIVRSPNGRRTTPAAYAHLGAPLPATPGGQTQLPVLTRWPPVSLGAEMSELGKILLGFGALLVILGAILLVLGNFSGKVPWLGRLPGDIYIQRGNWSFYFPLGHVDHRLDRAHDRVRAVLATVVEGGLEGPLRASPNGGGCAGKARAESGRSSGRRLVKSAVRGRPATRALGGILQGCLAR